MASAKKRASEKLRQSAEKVGGKGKRPLPKKLLNQLGKVPDHCLATQFGVTDWVVYTARVKLGIPSTRFVWPNVAIKLLGTASDEAIAKKLGLHATRVQAKRKRLGISSFGKSTDDKRHRWTKRELKLLGKERDTVIAKRIGINPSTVAWKRRGLGIPSLSKDNRNTGASVILTRKQIKQLGAAPDLVLAKEWGMHRHQVALYRRELGIENFVTRSLAELWTPEIIARLGNEPDVSIAKELKVPIDRVKNFRQQRRIPIAHEKKSGKPSSRSSP